MSYVGLLPPGSPIAKRWQKVPTKVGSFRNRKPLASLAGHQALAQREQDSRLASHSGLLMFAKYSDNVFYSGDVLIAEKRRWDTGATAEAVTVFCESH